MSKSLKLTEASSKKLSDALDVLEPHIASAAEVWELLTPEQHDALISHSPILARFISLAGRFTWLR